MAVSGASRGRTVVGAALAAATLCALAIPATAARDDLDLVSRGAGGAAAGAGSQTPALSADGRYVAFASAADNLAGPQLSPSDDIFVRDVDAGTTVVASRADFPADAASFDPSISADGGRVAFSSFASNLSGDDSALTDVFVRDLRSGTTILVSRADGPGGAGADGISNQPSISADGRFVAFVSDADGLAAAADSGSADVFVRDLLLGTTTLASRAPDGAGADGGSSAPSISADGRRVAFLSTAANLSAEDAPGVQGVFVRDLGAGSTTLASRATGAAGAAAAGISLSPSISADGTRVAFYALSPNLSDEDAPGANVFVRDLAAGTTTLASRATGAAGAGGDAGSLDPAISGDGTSVTFRSTASNLSPEDVDPVADVFARDLETGTTALVSRAAGAAGAGGDAASGEPSISADGRYVAFASAAGNLSDQDLDPTADIFRRDIVGVPAPPAAPAVAIGTAPARSAAVAGRAPAPRCAGRPATITGSGRPDVIRGTQGRDVIAALGGADVVLGLGGVDLICLGAGADRAKGGAGDDLIRGGPGRDLMLGGPGADLLIGAGGLDAARGGAGHDLCRVEVRGIC